MLTHNNFSVYGKVYYVDVSHLTIRSLETMMPANQMEVSNAS